MLPVAHQHFFDGAGHEAAEFIFFGNGAYDAGGFHRNVYLNEWERKHAEEHCEKNRCIDHLRPHLYAGKPRHGGMLNDLYWK
jgi:hypothetical protein